MTVDDETTLEQPAVQWDDTAHAASWTPDAMPVDDAQWDWPSRAAKPGMRVRVPTFVLVALLFAAGGLWGGAALQRSHGTGSPSSSAASSFASLFGNRGTAGRTGTGT